MQRPSASVGVVGAQHFCRPSREGLGAMSNQAVSVALRKLRAHVQLACVKTGASLGSGECRRCFQCITVKGPALPTLTLLAYGHPETLAVTRRFGGHSCLLKSKLTNDERRGGERLGKLAQLIVKGVGSTTFSP